MSTHVSMRSTRSLFAGAAGLMMLQMLAPVAFSAVPVGSFVAVLNESRNFGDSMNSVEFFNTNDLSAPLFSVYVGREPVGSNEWEEPGALAVNPATGDVYVLAFDSGSGASIGVNDPAGDSQGDYDLLKINFATIYNNWSTNYQGHNVNGEALAAGPAPTGVNNQLNLDYVTYASSTPEFNSFHANRVPLANAVEKIGQVARSNGAGDFFDYSLEFIDDSHLILLEDSNAVGDTTTVPGNPLDDHMVRVINRVSTSPGLATSSVSARTDGGTNYQLGGYNGANSALPQYVDFPQASKQSWISKVVEKSAAGTSDPMTLNLDLTGHSEPKAFVYYKDPVTNVRGVWITENDMPANGDAVAFMQLDANDESPGYRPIAGSTNPNYLTLSNDPAASFDLKGQADNIFVDKDSGDLIIVESGFNDTANGVGSGDHEPAVLRASVDYDDGSGQIQFSNWQTKKFSTPTKDTGNTQLIRGHWSTYDSVDNVVYFFMSSGGTETPPNEMDVYALDLDTGLTVSYMNVDDSVSLFLGDSFGDKAVQFTLAAPGLAGDFNSDGKVDAGDYATWRKNEVANAALANDNGVGSQAARFSLWRANFGKPPGAGSGDGLGGGSVPEPASAVLLVIGLAAFCSGRRRA